MTEAGVARIIKRVAINPHESSLNEIILYLEKKVLGSNLDDNSQLIKEPTTDYERANLEAEGYINCLQEINRLTKTIITLQSLLRKNNIEFKDFFDN